MDVASLEYVCRWESSGDAVAGGRRNLDEGCFPHIEGGSQCAARKHSGWLQDWLPAFLGSCLPCTEMVVLGEIDRVKKVDASVGSMQKFHLRKWPLRPP